MLIEPALKFTTLQQVHQRAKWSVLVTLYEVDGSVFRSVYLQLDNRQLQVIRDDNPAFNSPTINVEEILFLFAQHGPEFPDRLRDSPDEICELVHVVNGIRTFHEYLQAMILEMEIKERLAKGTHSGLESCLN